MSISNLFNSNQRLKFATLIQLEKGKSVNRSKYRQRNVSYNIVVLTVLFLFLQILSVTTGENLFCNLAQAAESKDDGHFRKVRECDCQDADWVPELARRVEAFYDDPKRAGDTFGHDWEAAKFLGKKSEYETMRNFKGLSPLFYNKEVYAGFNGTEQEKLFRKDKFLRKWAPNIKMFEKDFKPVSIEKIFDLGTIYISGSEVSLQKVEGLSKKSYGRLELIKQSGSGKDARYLYKVVAKDFEELNKLRAIDYAYDALRLTYYPGYDSRIDDATRKKIREEKLKEFKEYKEGNIMRGKKALKLYVNNPEEARRQGINEDPRVLRDNEKQKILTDIALLAKEHGEYGAKANYEVYVSLDDDSAKDHDEDLKREAHVYGVMREFRKEEDGYEYASLQYHMFQINSFLPGGIVFWHEGDTEKCQIILRRKTGEPDDAYHFYGVESSQHYYATSYRNDIDVFTDDMKSGKERFILYISYGSHASNFTPGYHLSAGNQKGPYVAQKFYGSKGYKRQFDNIFEKLITYLKIFIGALLDVAPGAEKSGKGAILTLKPAVREKGELVDTELTNKYILHTNYPDNAWIWMGFSHNDRNLHLGEYSILPGGSGPPLPRYFADIPGKSLFCNPIDHYYYYYRTSVDMAKVPMKLKNADDCVDLIISYGKLYRLMDDVVEKHEKLFAIVETIKMNQINKANEFIPALRGKNYDERKSLIDGEKERVDDIVKRLRNYIRPGNTKTDEGWLKLFNEIKKS